MYTGQIYTGHDMFRNLYIVTYYLRWDETSRISNCPLFTFNLGHNTRTGYLQRKKRSEIPTPMTENKKTLKTHKSCFKVRIIHHVVTDFCTQYRFTQWLSSISTGVVLNNPYLWSSAPFLEFTLLNRP